MSNDSELRHDGRVADEYVAAEERVVFELLERPGTYYVRIRGGAKTDREGMVVGW